METYDDELKIVLIGESAVGKTSIINRFVQNTFEENIQSTIGGTFSSKILLFNDGKKLIFNLWDTAGQERFKSLAKLFYKGANVAILVYDITNQNSFDKLKKFWINDVKENTTSDIILILAGNKVDLIEKEEVDEKDAKKFAEEMNIDCFRVSAKKDFGIEKLFTQIAKKYTGRIDFKFTSFLEEINKRKDSNNSEKKIIAKSNSVKLKKFSNKKKKKCC